MERKSRSTSGFTLVELLIVVIILGALAAIAIPQFTTTSDDAKLSALETSLAEMRSAIELYYHEHGGTYPGAHDYRNGNPTSNASVAATSFVYQLTRYSSDTGRTSNVKSSTYKYGPYLKKDIPKNPFNGLNTVICDVTQTDITRVSSSGTAGWKFYTRTGRFIANDGSHDSY